MKYFIYLIINILFVVETHAQTRIIFRGDDMGFSHAANIACIDAYKNGVVKSVEVIVPGPWFEEAVQLLNEYPDLDVGVHLALTSEWRLLKWKPLTYAPSLVDENGYFYPIIWPNEKYPGQALNEHAWDIDQVEKEFRAQIEMAIKRIPQVSHFTGHMGCTSISDDVKKLTKKLSKEYGLDIFPSSQGFQRLPRWTGKEFSKEQKMSKLKEVLTQLGPGNFLSVAHPAYESEETSSIHHIGYENVGEDRDGEAKVLTSTEIKDLLNSLKIEVIGYNEL